MAEWIFFEKSSQFDLEKSFIIKNRINWEQNVNININDIVYVYLSEPINSININAKLIKLIFLLQKLMIMSILFLKTIMIRNT